MEKLFYFKPSGNKWWPGYEHQEVVILEEFSSCFTCSSFLQLCDRAPFQVEYKGGHVEFNSRFVIILSNLAPGDQYQGVKEHKMPQFLAYMRRVENCYDVSSMCHQEIQDVVKSFFD